MLNPFSAITAPITVSDSFGNVLCNATSFVYSADEEAVYLVTNWHVLTGRAPQDPSFTEWKGVPTKAEVKFHQITTKEGRKFLSHAVKYVLNFDINDDEAEAPIWFEHPKYGWRADVAVISIPRLQFAEDLLFGSVLNCKDLETKYHQKAMDDVFVIGYPWGLTGGDPVLPLYKRGNIASEPVVDHDQMPRFLIDCRTAEGMSGSPVIARHSGIWNPSGTFGSDSTIGTIEKFVGIYSGRLKVKSLSAPSSLISEIGVVWREEVIRETIEAKAKALPLSSVLGAAKFEGLAGA